MIPYVPVSVSFDKSTSESVDLSLSTLTLSSFFFFSITLLVTARKKILTNGAAHSAFHKSQAKKKRGYEQN